MARQEAQLEAWATQANEWGEEIIAHLPADELRESSGNGGGSRSVGALYAEWPQYYYWTDSTYFHLDGPRTTLEIADDYDQWLQEQGWTRHTEHEFPPGDQAFRRTYSRDVYRLTARVWTIPPPMAQSIDFTISTPITDD